MILAGLVLAVWAFSQLPMFNSRSTGTTGVIEITEMTTDSRESSTPNSDDARTNTIDNNVDITSASATPNEDATEAATPAQTPTATTAPLNPIAVKLDGAPPALQRLTESIAISTSIIYTTTASTAAPVVRLDMDPEDGQPVQDVVFAAATRFDTIFPVTTWADVQAAWRGESKTKATAPKTVSQADSEPPDADKGEDGTQTGEEQNDGEQNNGDQADEELALNDVESELAAAAERATRAGMNVSMEDLADAGLTPPEIGADLAAQYRLDDAVQFSAVAVLSDTIPALIQVLGPSGPTIQGYGDTDALVDATWASTDTLALLPFDELQPRLTVLAINGQNPVENANRFDIDQYPFRATLYAHVDAANRDQQEKADAFLAQIPPTNRDPDKLTVLAMTGVTAMVRLSAAQIDRYGPDWVAEVVGPELAAADITHISNEVPWVPDCEANINPNNFNFCSPPEYMAALEDAGVDIIGLTGNHQNDFGREAALVSLDIYEEAGLPIYGGGRNRDAAFAPFYYEHNGNRLAFLGANSYGPDFAWATDNLPGSAEFNLAIMSATIRSIKEQDLADLVLPELQYQESYRTQPLGEQRDDFNALVRAGADIVTGVQSHVPQGLEFANDAMIVYGLGNLYFDQMWTRPTREGMIIKHTFYDGRHISTQILGTLLYDYAQPRWMSDDEREALLDRVFENSYWDLN